MTKVNWPSYTNIVALTGAGVSASSGLPTYRGARGPLSSQALAQPGPGGGPIKQVLWEEQDVGQVADATALQRDPHRVWRFFAQTMQAVRRARPNPAHLALAELEAGLRPDQAFVLLTQNIDRLHQRAGSRLVVELHGSLYRSRCIDTNCGYAREEQGQGADEPGTCAPSCPTCGRALRPDVVLFNEPLPVDAERAAKKALRDCDLFLAVGTSGTVSPASSFVRWAEYAGARTILVNLEPMDPRNPAFSEEVLGPAEETVPRLVRGG